MIDFETNTINGMTIPEDLIDSLRYSNRIDALLEIDKALNIDTKTEDDYNG